MPSRIRATGSRCHSRWTLTRRSRKTLVPSSASSSRRARVPMRWHRAALPDEDPFCESRSTRSNASIRLWSSWPSKASTWTATE